MGWTILAGCILAIVFGPAILAFLAPATTRLPVLFFVFGGMQIALGVTLYLTIYAGGGVEWPWLLLIAVLGVYYVNRGTQVSRLRTQSSDEGESKSEIEKTSDENREEPSRAPRRVT